MPIKIKNKLKTANDLLNINKIKKLFYEKVSKFIADIIRDIIQKGTSPVVGGGNDPRGTSGNLRFYEYSQSYKEQMGTGRLSQKKQRPINLTLTGDMLKSLRAEVKKNGVKVKFFDKKAVFHDLLGAGRSKIIRRLLPHSGEDFTPRIKRKIIDALEDSVNKVNT